MSNRLASAKWGYVTRRLPGSGSWSIGDPHESPSAGDFAVVSVTEIGAHAHLENDTGRRMRLYPGDVLVGAFGNRYATDFFEGYLPTEGEPLHLLTSGGLLGTVTSAHSSRPGPTEVELLGPLLDGAGRPVNTEDVALATDLGAPGTETLPERTIVVVGSSMNAGKTTAASAIVHGLAQRGVRVGAGKITGSGSGKDYWSYVDAGATCVLEFLDFGMPSTFGYPPERLRDTLRAIPAQLAVEGADVVVLEIADGLLHGETAGLIQQLPGLADVVVLAVGDALGAVAGAGILASAGVPVDAVSGLVTASPLAMREAAEATGLPVLAPYRLARVAAGVGENDPLPDEEFEPLDAVRPLT